MSSNPSCRQNKAIIGLGHGAVLTPCEDLPGANKDDDQYALEQGLTQTPLPLRQESLYAQGLLRPRKTADGDRKLGYQSKWRLSIS